jgi:hypothetical protein
VNSLAGTFSRDLSIPRRTQAACPVVVAERSRWGGCGGEHDVLAGPGGSPQDRVRRLDGQAPITIRAANQVRAVSPVLRPDPGRRSRYVNYM